MWTMDFNKATPEKILMFWFGEQYRSQPTPSDLVKKWFTKDPLFDEKIRLLFSDEIEGALAGELKHWESQPESALALLLLLDQFPRNIFRNLPKSFMGDSRARAVAHKSISLQWDKLFSPVQRGFFYLPFEHSENAEDQKLSVALFSQLYEFNKTTNDSEQLKGFLEFAIKHQEIIQRFMRFPHRNWVLGRLSTAKEVEFLKEPNSSF